MLRLIAPHAYQGNIVQVSRHEGHADLDLALARLGELDIASVMVESGGTLATALLKTGTR